MESSLKVTTSSPRKRNVQWKIRNNIIPYSFHIVVGQNPGSVEGTRGKDPVSSWWSDGYFMLFPQSYGRFIGFIGLDPSPSPSPYTPQQSGQVNGRHGSVTFNFVHVVRVHGIAGAVLLQDVHRAIVRIPWSHGLPKSHDGTPKELTKQALRFPDVEVISSCDWSRTACTFYTPVSRFLAKHGKGSIPCGRCWETSETIASELAASPGHV